MKTLEQHNKDLREALRRRKRDKLAGVLCDKCKTQMVYKDDRTLASSPPKRRVMCPDCEYEGTKVIRR